MSGLFIVWSKLVMKFPAFLVAPAVMGFVLHGLISVADAENSPSAPQVKTLLGSAWTFNPGKFTADFFIGTNKFLVSTNALMPTPHSQGTNRLDLPGPGVYRTEPFAGIVIVPGTNIDERMVLQPPNSEEKMPILRPNVRFIPWAGKREKEQKD